MRRKDREITDFDEMMEIVKKCDTCRLALNDGEYPYIVPLNFGHEVKDGKLTLYFHCANEGKKLDLIRKNNKVTFEMDCDHNFILYEERMSCTMGAKGEINDIYFDNIQVLNGDIPVSMIRGYQTPTEEVRVHDVHFDNITFMGNKCETWQDMRLVTELANDIYVNGARICRQMKF